MGAGAVSAGVRSGERQRAQLFGHIGEMRRNQQAPLYSVAMRSRADVRPAFAIARLLRDEKFALLHTHTPRAALIGSIAAAWAGVPMVHHVHSPTIADTTHRFKRWLNAASERASLLRTAAAPAARNANTPTKCYRLNLYYKFGAAEGSHLLGITCPTQSLRQKRFIIG